MTHEAHPTRSSDPDDTLRLALRCLASEQGTPHAESLGRRVMAEWRQEVAHSASDAHEPSFVETPAGFRWYGRRQVGITAVLTGVALLLVLSVTLQRTPMRPLTKVDVLSEMSLGSL